MHVYLEIYEIISGIPPDLQQRWLEAEDVRFDEQGRLDLKKYFWFDGASSFDSAK